MSCEVTFVNRRVLGTTGIFIKYSILRLTTFVTYKMHFAPCHTAPAAPTRALELGAGERVGRYPAIDLRRLDHLPGDAQRSHGVAQRADANRAGGLLKLFEGLAGLW
jgi:hypothetical protein